MNKYCYYMVAKLTSASVISLEDAEHHIRQAIKEIGTNSDVQIIQLGELFND